MPGGYKRVIDYLASKIEGKGDIRLNQVVTNVTFDEEAEMVQVRTDSHSFTAPFVVCTVPLGVLQSDTITFEPRLSPRHQNSLKAVGMGLLNKARIAVSIRQIK